jgi:DNA repair and recombination RAD54-like protein
MIVSYETLRTLTTYLRNCKIGLLLCDEGHRLKNAESLTYQTLTSLDVKRRVILTGTPIQVLFSVHVDDSHAERIYPRRTI